jgi:hypothetical protein
MEIVPSGLGLQCAAEAAATELFSAGRIPEAAASWHGALRGLLERETAALDGAGGQAAAAAAAAFGHAAATPETSAETDAAAPDLTRLRGAFTVHALAHDEHPQLSNLTSHDRTFALYASAIQYHPSPHPADEEQLEDDIALAAASAFNVGLCHHLQALVRGDRATACLAKALRAYEVSQRILEDAGFVGCLISSTHPFSAAPTQQLRALTLLLLAATNNVGHVFDHLHAHEAARQQLGVLHTLVALLGRDSAATEVAELASGGGPFAPFWLTTALHPRPGDAACPHHAPCA